MKNLFFFEKKTLPSVQAHFSASVFGWIQVLVFFSLLAAFCIAITVNQVPLFFLVLVPVLTRLISLDFQYHVLANIYILPVGFLGLAYALFLGAEPALASALGIVSGLLGGMLIHFVLGVLSGYKAGLGGGDIKFLAAAGAWLGVGLLPVMLWLALAMMLPVLFVAYKKKHEMPFGPALVAAFWLILLFKQTAMDLILSFILPI